MAAAEQKHPNIVLIITDQQNFRMMGCAGNDYVRTPALDNLAADGVRFERAYSVCPLCSPARAGMMTGLYPSAHGMLHNTDYGDVKEFRPRQLLYSHYLSRAGYRNAYVGKWHCGHDRLPLDYGIEGWSLPDYGRVYMSDACRRLTVVLDTLNAHRSAARKL